MEFVASRPFRSCSWPGLPMFPSMADALKTGDAEDRKLREKLASKVGRQVEGVASVRPAMRDGWVSWVGMGVDDSLAAILTAAAAFTATLDVQERRRARATGLETRMALAVTAHDAHLFRTRAMGRIVSDHLMTVPYGAVAKVTIGKQQDARIVAELVKVTMELTDGSKIKLAGDADHRPVFEQLRARAALIPVGTVPPAPEQRPQLSVVRALAGAAGRVGKGAVGDSGHV
jgi:hypothetical protein